MISKLSRLWQQYRVRLWLAVFFFCVGAFVAVPAWYPSTRANQETGIPPIFLSSGKTAASGFENWQIAVDWPLELRTGVDASIDLVMGPREQGQITGAGARSGALPEESADLFQSYNLVAVARLEMAGVNNQVAEMHEPLHPGRPVRFHWNIRSASVAALPGTIWLHLDLVPKQGGPVERSLLLARKIEIRSRTVSGIPGGTARIAGLGAVLLSAVLGYPYLWKAVKQTKLSRPKPGVITGGEKREDRQ